MAEYQNMPTILLQMRQAKKKSAYSTATQVADLNAFAGRSMSAGYLDALYQGRNEPSDEDIDVFTNYLLKRFYDYCSS